MVQCVWILITTLEFHKNIKQCGKINIFIFTCLFEKGAFPVVSGLTDAEFSLLQTDSSSLVLLQQDNHKAAVSTVITQILDTADKWLSFPYCSWHSVFMVDNTALREVSHELSLSFQPLVFAFLNFTLSAQSRNWGLVAWW